MSLFKKKDEDRKKAYTPTGDAKEKAGASGKGGGEPAKPKYDPKSKGFADIIEKRNNDGAFGYGYVDENTGIEVPWYIDMINGGGANAAGPEFVSPFAELPLEGGMLSLPSKIGNSMNIAPYGYNQPRKYAQAGMVGYPELPQPPAPAPTPQPSAPTPSPTPAPDGGMSIGTQNPAGLSFGQPMQNTMTYRPADVPDQLSYSSGQMPSADLANYQYNTSPTMRSLLGTLPDVLQERDTDINKAYMDYLLQGGTSTFQQYMQGMR